MEKTSEQTQVQQPKSFKNDLTTKEDFERDMEQLCSDSGSDVEEVNLPQGQGTQTNVKCIVDPHQFLEYATQNKKIKIMDEQNAILPHVYLKDISLHYKGPMEDKAYSRNYEYYINIRRGNTLCQIYNDKQEETDLFFCRRGMKKFFDLEKEYLSVENSDAHSRLSFQHQKYRRRIFEKIDRVPFEAGNSVNLYSVFKENGEHCQITYVKKLGYWLFASKNVSILARTKSDVKEHYGHIRFYWAKIIAEEFLHMISGMEEAKVEELKEELDTKTLLGEHCGNMDHQHITKYDKVQIIFYAIVEKTGEDHAMAVEYCEEFLKRFNFKMSKIKAVKGLKGKNAVYENIYRLLRETAEGTMDEFGEGSVLYVVEESADSKDQRTISMCKLKTTEYLIFRRMRQMLKLHVSRKSTSNNFHKFRFEIENIVKNGFKPPKELSFYQEVAKVAFKEAGTDKEVTQTYLRYRFVEFMQRVEEKGSQIKHFPSENDRKLTKKKIIVVCLPRFTQNKLEKYAKSQNISVEYMYRNIPQSNKTESEQCSLHILHMIPRLPSKKEELENIELVVCMSNKAQLEDTEKKLEQNKNAGKSHLISFLKSEDKRKSLELLNEKIRGFFESVKVRDDVSVKCIETEIQDKDQEIIKFIEELKLKQFNSVIEGEEESKQFARESKKRSRLLVIYPLLLPGSGKTTLANALQSICKERRVPFFRIDGDLIRKTHMEAALKQKGEKYCADIDHTDTFHEVKEQTLQEFENQLRRSIEAFTRKSEDSEPFQEVLFIDKVYGPEIMHKEIERISKFKSLAKCDSSIEPILLLPNSISRLNLKTASFPFSLQYVLICLKRCLEREDHETMTTKPQQICNRFCWYLKLYDGFSGKKLLRELNSIDQVIETAVLQVSTVEEKDETVHNILRKKLEECLNRCTEQACMELLEQIYKNPKYLQESSKEGKQLAAAQKLLSRIL